ncbi:MAG: hypothetical protein IGS39_08480 [Calothrix sp. C42_A2020_038]|nr:hypothetical protein [Calothrix sp. C42_A2020_038]
MQHQIVVIVVKAIKYLFVLLLVVSLTSCSGKAVSQEPLTPTTRKDSPQLTNQISEVSPPSIIPELRHSLDIYQPQVTIITPKSDEVLPQDTVEVRLQVKDLPIFKDSQFNLGSHLEVILDNQTGIEVYDLNQPLTLANLTPGTHTLRVFAERPWYESFKNEGAYAQTTFHVFTKTDTNNPDVSLPILTYNRPSGDYGAEPILLDFYLTNAPLQLNGRDISKNEIGDWRIRCTINDESFILDRWESIYLKGFKPGKNWIKLEFLDGKGEVIKNVFNSTVRSITYEPKGQDTLSRLVRGEFSIDQIRSIVDSSYVTKPIPKPTPSVQPTLEPTIQPTPEIKEPLPESTSEPQLQVVPEPAKPNSGFFKRRVIKAPIPEPSVEPTPSETPNLPEVITTPVSEVQNTPITAPEVEKPDIRKVAPTPLPTPVPETKVPEVEKPLVESPKPETSPVPSKKSVQPSKIELGKYFQRRESPKPTPETTLNEEVSKDVALPTPSPDISPVPETILKEEVSKDGVLPAPSPDISPVPETILKEEVSKDGALTTPSSDVSPTEIPN